MNYLGFIRANWRFLAFGVLVNLFSSAGQTYFISSFGGQIRAEFGLSHGGFGLIYALATVASAATLIWLGRLIDRVDLRLYAVAAATALIAASLSMSVVSGAVLLWAAIYALRLTGQGLMSHISVTSMARYFGERRGAAIGIASLGHTLGVAIFPLLAVALIAFVGWRLSWVVVAVGYAVLAVPLLLWLLKGYGARHRRYLAEKADRAGAGAAAAGDWTVGQVLRDPRFYLALPAVTATSFITTGFIFHQVHLVAAKGWSMPAFASGFIGFAAASFVFAFISGPLVDRVGAARLLPWVQAPLFAVLPLLAAFDHAAVGLVFLIGMGANMGIVFTVFGAVWAEVYGPTHLGAIRAIVQSSMVFASALSPVIMGWLIDAGYSMEFLALMCLAYVALVTVLVALPDFSPQKTAGGM